MAVYKPYRKTELGKDEIKIPYAVLADPPTIPDISGKLSKTENTGVSVLGTTKATTTLGGNQLVAPNGIIFAGTAANAGLVTRGICGVTSPDANGACSKENLYINYDSTNTFNADRQLVLQAGSVGTHYGNNLYQYAVPRGDIVKAWVEAKGYLTSHQDISGKANLAGGNTFSGLQTINAPTDVSGSETTTLKAKTSNGGAIVFGKEGPNSGTMIRLDQADGTCRLRFRGSSTAGAMVWEQPEEGAQLYVDLGKNGSDKHRVSFPSSAGTLALTSQIPTVNNGTLTIQKNGTTVQTFSANQSGNVTANITFHLYEHNIYLSCSNTTSTLAPSRAYVYFTVITTSATAWTWYTLISPNYFAGTGAQLNAGGYGYVGDPEGNNKSYNASVQKISFGSSYISVDMVYNNSLLGVDNTYSNVIFYQNGITITDKVRTIL